MYAISLNPLSNFLFGALLILLFLFCSIQLLSLIQCFVTPWTATYQASLSIINSQSLLKLMFMNLLKLMLSFRIWENSVRIKILTPNSTRSRCFLHGHLCTIWARWYILLAEALHSKNVFFSSCTLDSI